MNTEIFPDCMSWTFVSCGTCLKCFGLEAALKVGHRGTTVNLVEGMKDSKKTAWIG